MPSPDRTGALTAAEAHAIFTVLVEHAGASEDERHDFVHHQTAGPCTEYRFIGSLGFGGKFWRSSGWYVNTYPEQLTPAREQAISQTNTVLQELYARHLTSRTHN